MSIPTISAPMPSTPVGKAGAIPITTRCEPPNVTKRIPEDSIVYPHSLVFSATPKKETVHAWKSGMPLTARQSRVGETAPSFSNFRLFGDADSKTSIQANYNVRFLGVSYEGCPDYKTASRNPDSDGRFSVSISGKATVFCDTRPLAGAKIGDVIYALPEPAPFHWSDGHRQYRPPRLGYAPPDGSASGSSHAGDIIAAQLVCDGPYQASEYAFAFNAARAATDKIPKEDNAEVRTGINSFRGHPFIKATVPTGSQDADAVKELLRAYCTDEVTQDEIDKFVTAVDDQTEVFEAAMALTCGRIFKFASGNDAADRFGAHENVTESEHRALSKIIHDASGDDKVIVMKVGANAGDYANEAEFRAFMDKVVQHHRGFPFLGLAHAKGATDDSLKDIVEEARTGGAVATAGSFHQMMGQIKTAASAAARPAKRLRTAAGFGHGHFGSSHSGRFIIGTLVENGAWSGRNNEISILIDPRLSLC